MSLEPPRPPFRYRAFSACHWCADAFLALTSLFKVRMANNVERCQWAAVYAADVTQGQKPASMSMDVLRRSDAPTPLMATRDS